MISRADLLIILKQLKNDPDTNKIISKYLDKYGLYPTNDQIIVIVRECLLLLFDTMTQEEICHLIVERPNVINYFHKDDITPEQELLIKLS